MAAVNNFVVAKLLLGFCLLLLIVVMSNNNTFHNSAHIDIDVYDPAGCQNHSIAIAIKISGHSTDYQTSVIYINGEFYVFLWV